MTTPQWSRLKSRLLALALVLAVLATYWPVQHNDFVNYDDDLYVTENNRVRGGLGGGNPAGPLPPPGPRTGTP